MSADSTVPNAQIDASVTAATLARYSRLAPIYDWMETLPEGRYRPWRERFWKLVSEKIPDEGKLLEIGVGTGKNIPYWPDSTDITAIDLTPAMLRRAENRTVRLGRKARLELGDVQQLRFPDDYFDVAAMTFVMCSVPNPALGLEQLSRVVRPGGYVLMMEHVRSSNRWVGPLMDLLNPVVLRLMGPNINRDTVANVRRSSLALAKVSDLNQGGIFKIIEARVPGARS